MAKVPKENTYSPQDLKTLFEAMSIAPVWLSKRFIMQDLCGWSEQKIAENATLKQEEDQQSKIGNKLGGYR